MYELIGFATLNGGTTGGAGGPIIEVSTDSQLSDALTADDNPAIVVVNGTIEFENINVRSNKTIQGGEDPWIQEGRFNISNANNVIVTGIRMTDAWDDSINIQYSENVWIHRNTLESGFDGLCDIKHGSNYITVSWNHFKNHDKTMLIGADDSHTSDIGKLKTTIHHNFFDNCNQRTPMVRFGEVHSFNNYNLNTINGVRIGLDSLLYQEKCFYEDALRPYTYNSPPDGWVKDVGSKFVNTQTNEEDRKTDRPGGITWEPSSYYQYTAQDPDDAKRDVIAFAGHDPVGIVNIVSPEDNQDFHVGGNIAVETDVQSGDLEFLVNNNVVDVKNQLPYTFNIEAGAIDTDDYVLNLKFDGNTNDFSKYNNYINVVNVIDSAYVDGARDQGLSLGNSSNNSEKSYVDISPSDELKHISNRFTISYWIKGEPIFHRLFSTSEGRGIYFQSLTGGRIDLFLENAGPQGENYTLRSSPSSSNGFMMVDEWSHFAWTFDGVYLRCVYNFQQSNQLLIEEEIDVSSESNWLINRKHDSGVPGSASFDDFRVYDYAIPIEEIHKTVEDNYLGQLELKIRRDGITSDPITINIVESIPTFTITATATTGGQVSGDGEYEENEEVTLTATPDSGYEFVGWEEDSETVSTANPYIFNAEGDRVLLAVFELIPPEEYTISVTSTSGGNATGRGVYEEDDPVTLTATPDTGYEFVGWEEDSSIVSTSNPYIFNAEEDRSLLAVFQQIEYQLTVTYTTGGTATGSGEYIAGSQVQLTATPNSGYSFVGWYRGGTLISGANPYNYTTRGQADTVQAVFELIPIPEFIITVIPSTGGTVTGGGVYEEGQSVTLSAMPQSGWTFVKWSNDATDNPYSFTASENLTISAIFEEVNPEVPYIIVKGKFKIV